MSFEIDGEPVEAGGPSDRLLPWDRVQDIAGISRTTAWRMQRTGAFPRPVSISPGRVGWWESELTAWKGLRRSGSGLHGAGPPVKPRTRPREPKLIETARSARPKVEAPPAASPPSVQPSPSPEPWPRPAGRRKTAAADQFDFGF